MIFVGIKLSEKYVMQNTNMTLKEAVSTTFLKEKSSNEDKENELVVVELEKKEDIKISMSVIGDIMCHDSQYKDAYVSSTGTYDFSYVFADIKDYVTSYTELALNLDFFGNCCVQKKAILQWIHVVVDVEVFSNGKREDLALYGEKCFAYLCDGSLVLDFEHDFSDI